jgi:prevent-host-death family protein
MGEMAQREFLEVVVWVRQNGHGSFGLLDKSVSRRIDVRLPCSYGDYMITNLRDAKGRLSELVQRAADGEEIVITVRGEPLARLTAVKSAKSPALDRVGWVTELAAAAKASLVGEPVRTPQGFWDDLRGDQA